MNNRLAGLLGMATRARKVIFGEAAFESIGSKEASLLIISDDASERTMKKLINRSEFYGVETLVIEDQILNQATGNTTRKYCLIVDRGFSEGILDICRKR